jgi:hypothetical protein
MIEHVTDLQTQANRLPSAGWDLEAMIADLQPTKRGLVPFAILSILAVSSLPAVAQVKTPIPEYTGDRVYVREVADSYSSLNRAIKELERSSPQTYFAIVVRSAGAGPDAASNYVNDLYDSWLGQARAKGLKLDPERSVITLLAVENRRVAVHAGTTLRDRLGLGKTALSGLIETAFVPFAKEQRYAEATASLLASINNQVSQYDRETAAVKTGSELFPDAPTPKRVQATAAGPSLPAAPSTETSQQPAPIAQGTRSAPASTVTPAAAPRASTTRRDLTLALLASLVAVALIVAGLVWLARVRTRNSVASKIKEYKKQAVAVMDQLDALKARLKLLPTENPEFKEPMSGATLALYETTQTNITALWDRWLEVMDVLDKAQALAQKDTALGTEKLKEAEKLVSDPKVFQQIDQEAKACAANMDQLNQAHEHARAAAQEVVQSQKDVQTNVQKVEHEGLPTVPYKPEIDGIADQARQAGGILTPDPVGARGSLDQARLRATTLRERIEQILQRYDEGRKVSAELASLGQQVAGHRQQGLRLDEEGGNPDQSIAQTFQKLEALRTAVHEGDAQTALQQLQTARDMLTRSQETVDGVLKARDLCQRDLPERVRETRRLREAMNQYEAFQDELRRDFAAGSWQAVSGHLDQARHLLDSFDGKTDEAREASSTTTQQYLVGARLLGQVSQEQLAVLQLMSAVGDQLAALKAVREECQGALRNLDEQDRTAQRFFLQNDQAIGSMARGTLDSARQSREQLSALQRERPPDWPRIRQALAGTLEEYGIACNQAEADLQAYQQLSAEYSRVRQDAARVRAFLSSHQEDRLAANQHYQNAEDALARAEAESSGTGKEWARWLELVRGASADLAHAERLAREDVRVAHQAEAEIRAAVDALGQARAYFSMGVTVGTREAESQLALADQSYRSQNYEEAIRAAAAAIQHVRQAHAQAAQQASMLQMAAEADRRRTAMPATDGAFLAAGGISASGAAIAGAAASPERPQDPGSESRSSTASGSWSNETAEGGW